VRRINRLVLNADGGSNLFRLSATLSNCAVFVSGRGEHSLAHSAARVHYDTSGASFSDISRLVVDAFGQK
jgi:hypothetical protein